MEHKQDFTEAARKLASAYTGQPGFIDLLTFISDEHPDQAFVVAVWNTRSDAETFYKDSAPLLDLAPYVSQYTVDHYYMEPSGVFRAASGKAA
jgi:hypothetical protein